MHETYNHACDPERNNTLLPCNHSGLSSVSPAVTLNGGDEQDCLPCITGSDNAHSTSVSEWYDQEQNDTGTHEHSVAEMKAITSFYLTNLKFLRENIEHHLYSQSSYLQLLELLGAVGTTLPFREIIAILSDVLKSGNCHFIKKIRNFLQQSSFRTCILPGEKTILWDTISRSLEMLKNVVSKEHNIVDPSLTPAFQASKTVLEYSLKIFITDLTMLPNDELYQSLLAKVLSSTPKWSWYNEILNVAFILLEFNFPTQFVLLESVDILLGLALLPLRTCNTQLEREELSTTLAKQLSLRIARLPDSFKKYFVLLRIPSEHVRLKVIDIHLDNCFVAAAETSSSISNNGGINEAFSLSKFKVHLQKTVVGTGQDLGYFLSLLTMLLQSHLLIVSGVPMLSFIPDRQTDTNSNRNSTLQSQLADLNQPVTVFINRLSTDPATASYVITPTNWYYLELLIILTS